MSAEEEQLRVTPVDQRVLLLPHCLRHADVCKAKYDAHGLQCVHCSDDCAVNILTTRAKELGYLGVCVAPGGRLAVNFIKEVKPRAVVAVACARELMEGVEGVQAMAGETDLEAPAIAIVPLLKDGCVNTEVDIARALEVISTGAGTGAPRS